MFRVENVAPGLIRLTGRLDASQADGALIALSRITESAAADCSDLEYISSVGMGVLIQTYKRLHDAGQTFRLTNVTPRIRNVFQYAGLADLLGIE